MWQRKKYFEEAEKKFQRNLVVVHICYLPERLIFRFSDVTWKPSAVTPPERFFLPLWRAAAVFAKELWCGRALCGDVSLLALGRTLWYGGVWDLKPFIFQELLQNRLVYLGTSGEGIGRRVLLWRIGGVLILPFYLIFQYLLHTAVFWNNQKQ